MNQSRMSKVETQLMYEPMINIRISVVIPTRDRCTQVIRCLESLREQTMNDFEIIVVNDGATDKTKEELDQFSMQTLPFRLKLIHHRLPRGANPSRNEAINESVSELVAFLDDDCVADSQWLENLQAPLSDQRVAAVSGHVINVARSNQWERFFIGQHRVNSKTRGGIRIASRVVAGNMVVRRTFLAEALDEDRAEIPGDVRTSARGDEEGLRIQILRSGNFIAHAPGAICHHDHPYDFKSFCRQASHSGRSAAKLGRKYYLHPRWELLALALSTAGLPLAVWLPWFSWVCAVLFTAFFFAVIYNEIALKQKTILETVQTLPALLLYYSLRTLGYIKAVILRGI